MALVLTPAIANRLHKGGRIARPYAASLNGRAPVNIVILLLLLSFVASLPLNAAKARSPAESAPTGELIYYPQCHSAPDAFSWLLCDEPDA